MSMKEMVSNVMRERHIGDGLYASFDGYHVVLRAPGPYGDQQVFLEPSVLAAFDDYRNELKKVIHAVNQAPPDNASAVPGAGTGVATETGEGE